MYFVYDYLIDGLLDHMLYLELAHHVPGRIRIKASWSGASKLVGLQEEDIERIAAGIPGILEYRINRKALSLVIHYDPDVLSYDLWEEVALVRTEPLRREQVKKRLLGVLRDAGKLDGEAGVDGARPFGERTGAEPLESERSM